MDKKMYSIILNGKFAGVVIGTDYEIEEDKYTKIISVKYDKHFIYNIHGENIKVIEVPNEDLKEIIQNKRYKVIVESK